MQLCGQALCLEEMLCCTIPAGAVYYGEPRRREQVVFTEELRAEVRAALTEMHQYAQRGYTPKVKPRKGCGACSLQDVCLPKLMGKSSVEDYVKEAVEGMKKLRNTLFVLSEDAYLTLDGENVVVNREKQVVARYPLHTLTTILSFSYAGASPALMGACAQREIGLSFCSPRGKFLARVANQSNGNVLLRRTQYRMADDPTPELSDRPCHGVGEAVQRSLEH